MNKFSNNYGRFNVCGFTRKQAEAYFRSTARDLGLDAGMLFSMVSLLCMGYVQTRTVAGQNTVIVAGVWKDTSIPDDQPIQPARTVTVVSHTYTPRFRQYSSQAMTLVSETLDDVLDARARYLALIDELEEEVNGYQK